MAERAGSTTTEAPGSHSIYVSQPNAVAEFNRHAASGRDPQFGRGAAAGVDVPGPGRSQKAVRTTPECGLRAARGRRAGTAGHPPAGAVGHRTIRTVIRTGEQGAR